MRALRPLRRDAGERRGADRRACRRRSTARRCSDLLPPGAARNAVDCALWDLEAKRARAAGLAARRPAGAGAGDHRLHPVARHAGGDARARRRGTPHRPLLKIKLGGEGDMARLEAVRAGAPRARHHRRRQRGLDAPRPTPRSRRRWSRLGVELVEQPLPAGADDGAGRDGAAAAGLRRRELPRPRRAWPALAGQLRHGQRQARQDRRPDRGAGAARRGAGGGLRRHGRLHGRLQPRHGAGGAGGAGRGGHRSRRAAAAGARPRASAASTTSAGVHPSTPELWG